MAILADRMSKGGCNGLTVTQSPGPNQAPNDLAGPCTGNAGGRKVERGVA